MHRLPRNIHGVEPLLHAELDKLEALPVVKVPAAARGFIDEKYSNGTGGIICNLWSALIMHTRINNARAAEQKKLQQPVGRAQLPRGV